MAWASIVHEATRRPPSPPPGHVYHHTCFVYSPDDVSTSSPPIIAYISRNGDIKMRDIDLDWTNNPRIVIKELVTSKRMSRHDFEDILRLASQENSREDMKCSNACRHLREFQPGFDLLQWFGRQMAEIYLVALRSGLEDDLWEPDPPEYNPTSFPSCIIQ
ncbi:TPA_exp: Uncharacterized protein A8136_3128 [Trichophyton benhamiae CBS 112371]|uniref:Uncharacterized protein n=2 Tax=Trichophyton TaxID=5550 RepID=D4AZG1_ARTBC|nr:uncharacterized protein ARB_01579 [Trichophyton benhamiae CBS 112371]XP_003022362.1 uncharacterized protein TRV_03573 [Trichophyton verrucosum HKI 0517]EFE31431.1 hypothetical protein ARB_01579 [Trichophyton benhamiae CBS 112371]EFE41744.1 hypothetical protein TRV_03573 [Trichophyton verrucosum HKI 0517]DAA74590.1 TPA_exp: Uncharacterized protein A8136_3128 [Trichophyton benhamiae CBS 112371]